MPRSLATSIARFLCSESLTTGKLASLFSSATTLAWYRFCSVT